LKNNNSVEIFFNDSVNVYTGKNQALLEASKADSITPAKTKVT